MRLVEAVHFVDEHDGSSPGAPRVLGRGHHFLDFLDPGQHGAERNELGMSHPRDQARQRCFPASRRSPKNHGADFVVFDLCPKRFSWPEQSLLPREFIERAWAHPFREGLSCGARTFLGLEFREQAHEFC